MIAMGDLATSSMYLHSGSGILLSGSGEFRVGDAIDGSPSSSYMAFTKDVSELVNRLNSSY